MGKIERAFGLYELIGYCHKRVSNDRRKFLDRENKLREEFRIALAENQAEFEMISRPYEMLVA